MLGAWFEQTFGGLGGWGIGCNERRKNRNDDHAQYDECADRSNRMLIWETRKALSNAGLCAPTLCLVTIGEDNLRLVHNALRVFDSRIEKGVRHINDQIDYHKDRREKQRRDLDNRKITI